jgi:phosphorylcholine metabolism protein LicD
MSTPKFNKEEHNRNYYAENKERIAAKRANQYGLKLLNDQLRKIDFVEQRRSLLEAIRDFDPTDESPENNMRYNEMVIMSQLLASISCAVSDEARKMPMSMEWLMSLPMRGDPPPPKV